MERHSLNSSVISFATMIAYCSFAKKMLPPPLFCVGLSGKKGDGSAAPKAWRILMVTSKKYFFVFCFLA